MAQTKIRGNTQIKAGTVTEAELNATVAGNGISGGAGSPLAVDFNELTAAAVDVANDEVTIVDATDGTSKKESIADLMTAVAGDGLVDAAGVLAVNVDGTTIEIATDTLGVVAGGIGTTELATDAVTNAKIADDAVDSAEIASGAVDVDHLSDLRTSDGGGLTLNYAAGTLRNDNNIIEVTSGTVTLTDDSTNYVEVDSAGTVSANTSGYTSGRLPLARVTTVAGAITTIDDDRAWLDLEIGAGGLTESNFVDRETPTGTVDGTNTTFTLANTPTAGSEHVYLNGVLQEDGAGEDYTISGGTITFNNAPQTGDRLVVSYRK